MWTEGTALYHVLSVPESSWPVLTDPLLGRDTGLVLAACAAVALWAVRAVPRSWEPAIVVRWSA